MAASLSRQRTSTPSTPLLSTFQKHIEDMRNLVLCKVCIKPLYEPYNLGCGHTYCYTCLASWFGGVNKRKRKTCPDCRTQVTAQPTPNYLLRDLVHMFISRIELLPEDETTNEHDDAKRAEALQIETDKGPGGEGLFKGAFKSIHVRTMPDAPLRFIRDHEDGVDRCPVCHWEIEGEACMHCGYNYSDSDEDSDESDDARALPSPSIISTISELDGDFDGDDHDLEDEYDEDDGFVEPDHHPRITQSPRPEVSVAYRNGQTRHGNRDDEDTLSDTDEGEEEEHLFYTYGDIYGDSDEESDGAHTAVPNEQSEAETNDGDEIMASSDEESDDESEIITGARRHHHGPTPQSRREETPSVAEPNSPGSFYAEALAAGDPGYGFSPVRSTSSASSDSVRLRSNPSNTESDQEVQSMTSSYAAGPNRIPRRPARVVISSDDESDENTPTPPRSGAERRAHLRSHRARRGGRGRGGGFHAPNPTWSQARRRFQEQTRR